MIVFGDVSRVPFGEVVIVGSQPGARAATWVSVFGLPRHTRSRAEAQF